MAFSDSELCNINGKPYYGQAEAADDDGLIVRAFLKGIT